MVKVNIYIDGNNLYRAATELGYKIDYKKFRGQLRQKYNSNHIYLFLNDHYHKFAIAIQIEKAPYADVSA